ncbi:uncharacterized protein [Phaseolus vulgaris]|uniref:uncharacterized protein n=1 Tax=Phaseolus vulgaris TaxID=3885 RepID=UPI0035C97351
MAVNKDLLESVQIGGRLTKVNMLQFADDTLFLCKASAHSVFVIKAILICFELASGLKVNFQKSSVGRIGCNNLLLQRFATVLNCATMKTPFKYLGMLVGGNHRRSKFWEEVVKRVRRRLGKWKGKFISMAGRLCLIKSVLSALSLFYMSLYKMPVTVANEIVRLQRNFLWGWGPEGRRIVWASWDKVREWSESLGWVWKIKWRRNLFEWELSLERQLMHILRYHMGRADKEDRWEWNDRRTERFTIK